jgi:hypothetical protein
MEKPHRHFYDDDKRDARLDDDIAVTSDDSFPASDAPSWTPVSGIGGHQTKKQKERAH